MHCKPCSFGNQLTPSQKVQIRDMQSLHGTYINCDENKVGCHAQDLKDGDMLRFGIPVIRGGEVFPPTAVKVALTFYEARVFPFNC